MINDLEQITQKYSKMITAISYRMIENREIAKEAAQEVWIEIIKSLPNYKGASTMSTWIYTIASRTILRYAKNEQKYSAGFIRKYLNRDEIYYSSGSDLEEKEWVKEMCDKCITGAIHCLTNEERLIYLFYDVAGLDSKQIADIIPVTDILVRKKMSRSRKKLQRFLSNQCILYNPTGNCKCRMIKNVAKVNLAGEFQKIKADIREISFLRQCELILSPDKSFLEKLCHKYQDSSTNE